MYKNQLKEHHLRGIPSSRGYVQSSLKNYSVIRKLKVRVKRFRFVPISTQMLAYLKRCTGLRSFEEGNTSKSK